MMYLYQHWVIQAILKRNPILFFSHSEPTTKALSRTANATQTDEPSERANQMIMVRSFDQIIPFFSLFQLLF